MASQWPASRDFVEAIQNPKFCFSNPELRSLTPALDKFGMPVVTSGQFAYVFKLNNPNGGKAQAIRCFRGLVGDREKRYEKINAHLDRVSVPYFASFEYDSLGILINGVRYPTLVMEWITGSSLDLYIASVLTRPDVLKYLGESWLKLLSSLRDSGTSHGDLQHGNIIIENNAYRLVDLDGLWVPSMSGWNACELGHRHYQHPGRTGKQFDKNLDNFSGLVIYLSIMALAERPDLWNKWHDENLIFTKRDFDEPRQSELFRTLKQMSPMPRRLAETLEDMCKQDPTKCPSVLDLVESGPNKLPTWMQDVPNVTVQTATREAGLPTAVPPQGPPPPPPSNQTAGSPWWQQPAASPGTLSHPIPPPPSVPSPTMLPTQLPTLWSAVFRRAVNVAWVSLLGIWLWYPMGRNIFAAGGLDPQQAGIWTVFSFVGLCAGIGYYKEREARMVLGTSVQTASAGAPLIAPSTWLPQPVYVPTQYSPPVYTPPQPVRTPATPPPPAPVFTQPRPSPQPPAPIFQPAPTPPIRRPATSSSGSGAVVGSRVRSVYHRPSCRWTAKISLRNRRQFSSAADARNAGFKPCGICNP